MSGKRTRSFKCAVHHRDREVCSENDFHLLVHEPPLFRRYDYLIFYRHKTSFHLFSRRKPMFKRRKVVNRSMNILRIILHVRLDKDTERYHRCINIVQLFFAFISTRLEISDKLDLEKTFGETKLDDR